VLSNIDDVARTGNPTDDVIGWTIKGAALIVAVRDIGLARELHPGPSAG
jgi:hypothetical protein